MKAINHYLKETLEKAGCLQGHLTVEYNPDAPTVFIFNGTRKDSRKMIFWELAQSFKNDIDALLSGKAAIRLYVDIDLSKEQFDYSTGPLPKPEPVKPEVIALSEEPYGHELARAVADELEQRDIGYRHRDYCGTGMEKHGDTYTFGPILDGGMIVKHQFTGRDAFIEWLAVQSDKSLSEGEPYNPQDICRKRLEDWLAGQDS